MATTPVPFLYQTQTLLRRSTTRRASQLLASFHSSTPVCLPRAQWNQDRTRAHEGLQTERKKGQKKVGHKYWTKKDWESSSVESGEVIPFDLPANLMSLHPKSSQAQGTITQTEREVFDRIFEEIAARKPSPAAADEAQDAVATTKAPNGQPTIDAGAIKRRTEDTDEQEQSIVNVIISDAANQSSPLPRRLRDWEVASPLATASAAPDQSKALERFPPSLRAAAKLALGVISADGNASGEVDARTARAARDLYEQNATSNKANKLQGDEVPDILQSPDSFLQDLEKTTRRRQERERIEQLMNACKTDFELWHVLEGHVFPIVAKVGLEPTPSKGKKRKPKVGAETDAQEAMSIYGPLYPSLLLSALRLLDTHFARPSPLTFNVLPRIKQLGLSSYVLGVSTPLYNSLMEVYWHRHGDAHAVMDLLEEMRHAGLYFDETSFAVVQSMNHYLTSFASGENGDLLKEVMTMPNYRDILGTRLRHWMKQIGISINERKQTAKG